MHINSLKYEQQLHKHRVHQNEALKQHTTAPAPLEGILPYSCKHGGGEQNPQR